MNEIQARLQSELTDSEIRKLVSYSEFLVGLYTWRGVSAARLLPRGESPQSILSIVIEKLLNGKVRWRTDRDELQVFLRRAIRREISHLARLKENRTEIMTTDDVNCILSEWPNSSRSSSNWLREFHEYLEQREESDLILMVSSMLEGITRPSDLSVTMGLEVTNVYNIKKRLRRRLRHFLVVTKIQHDRTENQMSASPTKLDKQKWDKLVTDIVTMDENSDPHRFYDIGSRPNRLSFDLKYRLEQFKDKADPIEQMEADGHTFAPSDNLVRAILCAQTANLVYLPEMNELIFANSRDVGAQVPINLAKLWIAERLMYAFLANYQTSMLQENSSEVKVTESDASFTELGEEIVIGCLSLQTADNPRSRDALELLGGELYKWVHANSEWSEDWGLGISPDSFCVVFFVRQRERKPAQIAGR